MAHIISKKAYQHILLCLCTIAIIGIALLVIAKNVLNAEQYAVAMNAVYVISAIKAVEVIAIALIWAWVAKNHTDYLTTFFTACSGFRMLFSLIVLAIIYAIVDASSMIYYIIAFFAIYFVLLVIQTIFFSKATNHIYNNTKG